MKEIYGIELAFLEHTEPLYSMIKNCKSMIDYYDIIEYVASQHWFPDRWTIEHEVWQALNNNNKFVHITIETLYKILYELNGFTLDELKNKKEVYA